MLQPLGISADAEAVYVGARPDGLRHGPRARPADHDRPGRRPSRALLELRNLGLAAELSPGLWQALPLLEVANALRAQRLSELEMASGRGRVAAEPPARGQPQRGRHRHPDRRRPRGRSSRPGGRSATAPRRRSARSTSRRTSSRGPTRPPTALDEMSPEWQALERGVQLRGSLPPRLRQRPAGRARAVRREGRAVPDRAGADETDPGRRPGRADPVDALVLRRVRSCGPRSPGTRCWSRRCSGCSRPSGTRRSRSSRSGFSENDPRRQMLISLLMTGSTDSAIATQLGHQRRSVRRWIAELMDELGVTTRLQLGAALVRADALRGAGADPIRSRRRRQSGCSRAASRLVLHAAQTAIQPASRRRDPATRKKSYVRGSRRNRGRSPGGGDREGPRGKTLPDYMGLSA